MTHVHLTLENDILLIIICASDIYKDYNSTL